MKETKVEDYRIEKDSLGTRDIPGDVYYGVQSLRAAENFHITGLRMHPEIINSLAYIKKAAAITNWKREKLRRLCRLAMRFWQVNSGKILSWTRSRVVLEHPLI